MQIPSKYRGKWRGDVTPDSKRDNVYKGDIVLHVNGGDTTYDMQRGVQRGKLTLYSVSDGFLLFKETVSSERTEISWKGSLLIYFDIASNLKCVWTTGTKFSAESIMQRME